MHVQFDALYSPSFVALEGFLLPAGELDFLLKEARVVFVYEIEGHQGAARRLLHLNRIRWLAVLFFGDFIDSPVI